MEHINNKKVKYKPNNIDQIAHDVKKRQNFFQKLRLQPYSWSNPTNSDAAGMCLSRPISNLGSDDLKHRLPQGPSKMEAKLGRA